MMQEIAIVGGGLCGLMLAKRLQQQGRIFTLFEARTRFGGRILTASAPGDTMRVDLGPTWIWPQSQPLMTQLVAELGLASFEQHDRGTVWVLNDPDKSPEPAQPAGVHGGAQRLTGGMASLTDALVQCLPPGRLHLDHVLHAVFDREDHLELHFRRGDEVVIVRARHAVLAVPPRLLAEHVHFEPALDDEFRAAMNAAPTWMAARAKAIILYRQATWRTAGQSGNAFVRHEQAVLGEIFDTCDAEGGVALGGFIALSPALRRSFQVGLPMLMSNQMTQVFGAQLEERGQLFQDWASEPHTCSERDLTDSSVEMAHTGYGNPLLRQPLWANRLHFGGSETAAYGGGYLEGALEAALRIHRELATLDSVLSHAASSDAASVSGPALRSKRSLPATASGNAASVAHFRRWVQAQQQPAFEGYRQRINHSLAVQQREQLTQRAMLGAMEQLLSDALTQLDTLPFDTTDVAIERGRCALTPQVQSAFQGFIQTLLNEIVAFNRTSCALSNFPDEHQLSKDYEQTILRDVAAAWREFSLSANSLLLSKRGTLPPRSGHAGHRLGIAP